MTWETQYRPAVEWLKWLCEGWTVEPMMYHHQRWILITRRVR